MLARPPRLARPPLRPPARQSGCWLQRCHGASILLVLVAGALLLLLRALPYSSSTISKASNAAVIRSPTPDFEMAGIRWTVEAWSEAPELAAFRQDFVDHCARKRGVAAAVCVSDRMARAFPNGSPLTEAFAPVFDPTEHLRAHAAGRPGHCVTRSAILSAELLAVGIPARMVQLLGPDGPDSSGHTAVEVWGSDGWTLVDPTYGRVLHSGSGGGSALALVLRPSTVRWQPGGVVPAGSAPPGVGNPFAGGTILYPEPWLYVRLGQHAATWPFRARFARAGKANPLVGPAQTAAVLWILLSAVGAAVCGVISAYSWLCARRAYPPPGADQPIPDSCAGQQAVATEVHTARRNDSAS